MKLGWLLQTCMSGAGAWGLVWMLNVVFGQFILPRVYIQSCAAKLQASEKTFRLAIIGDPQLTDFYSYSQPHPSLILSLTQIVSDVYMRQNFALLQHFIHPDAILFMGDLFDGGREISIAKASLYSEELDRFRRIFRFTPVQKVFYSGGNHDFGFGAHVIPHAYARFNETFGLANYAVNLTDSVELIVLDTVSLSAEQGADIGKRDSFDFAPKDLARSFLNSWPEKHLVGNRKRILSTHVPLYRPPRLPCGTRRTRPPIAQGRGYQYQNLIVPELSDEILRKLEPDLILSGDDHDDCAFTHVRPDGRPPVPEGNDRPSFGIVDVPQAPTSTLNQSFSLSDNLIICNLPLQKFVYFWYIVALVVSCAAIAMWGGSVYFSARSRRSSLTSDIEYVELPAYASSVMPKRPSFTLSSNNQRFDASDEDGDVGELRSARSRRRALSFVRRSFTGMVLGGLGTYIMYIYVEYIR